MLWRKSTIGIAVLAVTGLSCFAAANASAGARAHLCTEAAAIKEFSDPDCSLSGGTKTFGTLLIAEGSATSVSSSNVVFPWKLAGSLAGVATEVQCSFFSGFFGTLTNAASSVTGTMSASLSGCSVIKPAGKGCLVSFGEVELSETEFTTVGVGANEVKIRPAAGTEIGTVPIEGCSVKSLNNKFPITGSFLVTASGATLTSGEAAVTAQNTLKFGGNKAGLESTQTVSGGGNAIAFR